MSGTAAACRQRAVETGGQPLVAHQEHGLGDVKRGEFRVHRKRDDGVGKRDLLVGEAPALAPEEQAASLVGDRTLSQLARRLTRPDHSFRQVARACGRGVNEVQIGDRVFCGIEDLHFIDDASRAACRRPRLLVRPAVPRPHQAEIDQAEIRHCSRRSADVFPHLRLDEDDRGRPSARFRLLGQVVVFSSAPRRRDRFSSASRRVSPPWRCRRGGFRGRCRRSSHGAPA